MTKEADCSLSFTVVINTYGKKDELRPKIAKALAKVCALSFGEDTLVTDTQFGGRVYRWRATDHGEDAFGAP